MASPKNWEKIKDRKHIGGRDFPQIWRHRYTGDKVKVGGDDVGGKVGWKVVIAANGRDCPKGKPKRVDQRPRTRKFMRKKDLSRLNASKRAAVEWMRDHPNGIPCVRL